MTDADADPLLDLFRQEVGGRRGRPAERAGGPGGRPGPPDRLEPLERAAHAVQGAARIVGPDDGGASWPARWRTCSPRPARDPAVADGRPGGGAADARSICRQGDGRRRTPAEQVAEAGRRGSRGRRRPGRAFEARRRASRGRGLDRLDPPPADRAVPAPGRRRRRCSTCSARRSARSPATLSAGPGGAGSRPGRPAADRAADAGRPLDRGRPGSSASTRRSRSPTSWRSCSSPPRRGRGRSGRPTSTPCWSASTCWPSWPTPTSPPGRRQRRAGRRVRRRDPRRLEGKPAVRGADSQVPTRRLGAQPPACGCARGLTPPARQDLDRSSSGPYRHPLSPPAPPAPPAPRRAEAVVRVTAQSLNRLMSLAGESLVQARWLQPFARSLLEAEEAPGPPRRPARRAGPAPPPAGRPTAGLPPTPAGRLADCRDTSWPSGSASSRTTPREAEDLNSRLYREVIVSRMRPFADGAHGLPRLVRDMARQLGKQVRLEIDGQATEVDRDILEKLEAPLDAPAPQRRRSRPRAARGPGRGRQAGGGHGPRRGPAPGRHAGHHASPTTAAASTSDRLRAQGRRARADHAPSWPPG